MSNTLKEVTMRVAFPCDGSGPTDTIWLEVSLDDLIKAGEMINANPEMCSGDNAALNALSDLWKSKGESESEIQEANET